MISNARRGLCALACAAMACAAMGACAGDAGQRGLVGDDLENTDAAPTGDLGSGPAADQGTGGATPMPEAIAADAGATSLPTSEPGSTGTPTAMAQPDNASTQPVGSGQTPTDLPSPSGSCPELREGTQSFAGVNVNLIAVGPAGMPGPVILYWHGTGSNPGLEVPAGVGQGGLQSVRATGGVVAGFISGQTSGQTTSGNDVWNTSDRDIADEVVACAIEAGMADTRQIHSLGMSAGGLMTTNFSYARSNYLASVVTYSGGHIVFNGFDTTSTTSVDPANHFAALIFHGGPQDVVVIPFKDGSEAYSDHLRSNGHLTVLCDHGSGHTIPNAAVGSVWQFFMDHPYKRDPSPYASGLPSGFPAYCESP